jgi:pyruvate/2-oxoglutarate dehydrogenase complex dihydrolipoamide dehydrogenase (E3) component
MAGNGMETTEVLVIGGGPGGYAAAFRAADLGLSVTLVSEEERLGGVCLLRGCSPSTALLEVAELLITSRQASDRGVEFSSPEIDLDRLRSWKDGIVVVDDPRRTEDSRIYAIGDVAGGMLLAHEAMHEGTVAAEAIAGEPASFDVRAIPAVVEDPDQTIPAHPTVSETIHEATQVAMGRPIHLAPRS